MKQETPNTPLEDALRRAYYYDEHGQWRGPKQTNGHAGTLWLGLPQRWQRSPTLAGLKRPNHQMTGAPRPVDQALGKDNT